MTLADVWTLSVLSSSMQISCSAADSATNRSDPVTVISNSDLCTDPVSFLTRHSKHVECITHVGHLITFLHFVTFWPSGRGTSSEALQYRQDLVSLLIRRENTSLSMHVVQKITIIRAQKTGKSAVWNLILCTLYSVVAPLMAHRKIWTEVYNCKSSPIKSLQNIFKNFTLTAFRWAQMVALHSVFGTTSTNLTVICGTL